MLRSKKFLTSAVVAACVLFGTGVVATTANAYSDSIPAGQALTAWDPNNKFLVEIDVPNSIVENLYPDLGSLPVQGYVEGGGYDPVTQVTWIVGDNCLLSAVFADGLTSSQFTLGIDYIDCWAFLANGDGTAYVAATKVSTNTIVVAEVNLNNNQVVSISELGTASTTQITGMSRNSSGEVWVSIIGDVHAVARLNFVSPQVLSISDAIDLPVEVWDIAFASDDTLWLAAWPDGFDLRIMDVANPNVNPIINLGTFNYPFAGSFETDALWFPNAYTYATRAAGENSFSSPSPSPSASPSPSVSPSPTDSPSPSASPSSSGSPSPSSSPAQNDASVTPAGAAAESLAITGLNLGGYLMLSGAVLALGIVGIWLSRRKLK